MITAIKKNLADFLAIVGVVVLGLAIGAYILVQPAPALPARGEAVLHGEGRAARRAGGHARARARPCVTAGVRIGDIGKVDLEDGKAVVTLQLEPKYKGFIREDATALLRAKTGTKDMFLEVDPGDGKPLPEDGRIQVSNTLPDIDPDEFLSALDARHAQLPEAADLRRRQGPRPSRHRPARGAEAARPAAQGPRAREPRGGGAPPEHAPAREPLRPPDDRARQERQGHHPARARLERDARRVRRRGPEHLGARVEAARHAEPDRVDARQGRHAGAADGPDLRGAAAAVPQARRREQGGAAVREGGGADPEEPGAAVRARRAAVPAEPRRRRGQEPRARPTRTSRPRSASLNRLFDIGAYNPGGTESISDGCEKAGACTPKERARNEGYLYWLGWVGQNTTSLFSTADALGPIRRAYLLNLNCGAFTTGARQAGMGDTEVDGLAHLFGALGACSAP